MGYRGSSGITYGQSWWNAKARMRMRYAYQGNRRVGVVGYKNGKPIWWKRF